jgi:hypothetical protein
MNSRILVALALALLAATQASRLHAQDASIHGQVDQPAPEPQEEAWPMETTGDISILIVRERYRISTTHCAELLPDSKPAFDAVIKSLSGRIRSIGMRLLDTDAFRDMKQQQVSSTLVGALSSELRNIQQELEDQDPSVACPQTLQNYRSTTDALLEDFLKRTLAGVRVTANSLKGRP